MSRHANQAHAAVRACSSVRQHARAVQARGCALCAGRPRRNTWRQAWLTTKARWTGGRCRHATAAAAAACRAALLVPVAAAQLGCQSPRTCALQPSPCCTAAAAAPGPTAPSWPRASASLERRSRPTHSRCLAQPATAAAGPNGARSHIVMPSSSDRLSSLPLQLQHQARYNQLCPAVHG